MLKTIAFAALGLVAGFVVAAWWLDEEPAAELSGLGDPAEVSDRLGALERAPRAEEQARADLERHVETLEAEVLVLAAAAPPAEAGAVSQGAPPAASRAAAGSAGGGPPNLGRARGRPRGAAV